MAQARKSTQQGERPTTIVLLKNVPVFVHRAMKAEAARRGVRIAAVYVEACERYLRQAAEGATRRVP